VAGAVRTSPLSPPPRRDGTFPLSALGVEVRVHSAERNILSFRQNPRTPRQIPLRVVRVVYEERREERL